MVLVGLVGEVENRHMRAHKVQSWPVLKIIENQGFVMTAQKCSVDVFRFRFRLGARYWVRNRSVKFEVKPPEETRFSRPLKIVIFGFLGGSPRFWVKIEKLRYAPKTPSKRSK